MLPQNTKPLATQRPSQNAGCMGVTGRHSQDNVQRKWRRPGLQLVFSSSARHGRMQERLGPDTDLSTDELFRRVLEDLRTDDDERLGALVALHERPTRQVIDRCIGLCKSSDPYERTVGLRILRELGHPYVDRGEFWAPLERMVIDLVVSDESPDVVRWAISCLGYQATSAEAFVAVLSRAEDTYSQIRFAVAAALPGLMREGPPNQPGIAALLGLAEDADADVRSYAIMGLVDDLNLASMIAPTLRAHLSDPDEQIAAYCQQALNGT